MSQLRIPVSLRILDSISDIEKMVNVAFRDELNRVLPKAVPSIQTAIQNRSRVFFETSKEALALINGPLDAHFGIPQGEAQMRVGSIIQTVINNIEVSFARVAVRGGKSLTGGLKVGIIVAGFQDVLSNPEAHITTDKGEDLPWLEWLLIRGDEIIIYDAEIRIGNYSNPKFNSRSGKAIMVEVKHGYKVLGGSTGGGSNIWRVPPEYSGTANNNWLIRSILSVSDAWESMIVQVMQEKIEAAI